MSFEIDSKTFKWLINYKIITPADVKQTSSSTFQIKEPFSNQFENGTKISSIVTQIYKKAGLPIPATLNHLKQTNGTAAQLYNWNILNDALKKVNFQIDSQTKNLIINGDRTHLAMIIRKLIALFDNANLQDSLASYEKPPNTQVKKQIMKQSLTLSRSQQPQRATDFRSQALAKNIQQNRKPETRTYMAKGDLLQFVVNQLTQHLKISKKQVVALLSDNNKYLAHALVKGIKGSFVQIQSLLQKFYSQIDYIVQKMAEQNDMCFYFLQIIKPCLLSKSEQIAQWGCRILTKIAHQLAIKQLLPLAYDWFVQQSGGLSTTILALSRHPKLNQNVVGFILQFSRYNVTQLFTVQLRKITNNDNLVYVKFMLLIFNPLTQSKISAEQLLQSGAIDYWIQISLKGAQNDFKNSKQLRMYCIEFLIKIWRAYPSHIQQTLDHVNNIMNQIKRGIRDDSQIMRFSLMEFMFDLLDEFASKKNPYASIVYKKITFLFIENHEELTMREFMLRNLQVIFQKYQSIPVQIFLQPFIKQIKISQSKSYLVNIFDMEFINVAVRHRKLKVGIGLELFDLLAKTKLNSYSFSNFATEAMEILINKFLAEDIFLQYTIKLVKISLAMFYSTLKHKKPYQDQQRLQSQKRAQIVNMIISLIQRSNAQLNEEIKNLVVHVKVQIYNRLNTQHKGIQRILGYFKDVDQAVREAMQNINDQITSNATSTAKDDKSSFHLPKIQNRNAHLRDQTQSQQSLRSRNTKYSQNSKQQFPIKDYTQFAEQDQKKFLKQNGLGLKKKGPIQKRTYSAQKQSVDPKIQQQLIKIKQKKQQQEKKKLKQKQQIQKKKQLLKQKIQKQLQQRNVKQGLKGLQKDVQVKVLFQENQINDNILVEDDQNNGDRKIQDQQVRDKDSIGIVLKRYGPFIKKIYNRYANLKGGKKDISQAQNVQMAQVDLLRLCRQKNIEKNKNTIIQILKEVNNKNVSSLTCEVFVNFLQALCIQIYVKQKYSTKVVMGEVMKKMLKKMSEGQNFKLDEDDDPICRDLSEKIRYNPHIQLPQNFKKIYERVYKLNQNCSYPVKKAIKNQGYIACYEIINQIFQNCLKVNIIQQQVRFVEEGRVVHKKQAYMPPKPLKTKEKQQVTLPLLGQKQTGDIKAKKTMVRSASRPIQQNEKQQKQPLQSNNVHSKSRSKIVNQAQKKKQEQQQQTRKKKQIQQQLRKQRALQVKRKLQKQQQQREKQKQRKQQQKKQQQEKQQQQIKKQKQKKQKYLKEQKQKLQKYKKQQEDKQKQQKLKNQQNKLKQEQQRKLKLKQLMKKDQEKRKQQQEKRKKQRQLSQQKNKKKKQQDEKKKQQFKKQMAKKMQEQKQKLEITKMSKQIMNKIYHQPQIQDLINNKYKQQLKAIFIFGKQYNQFKLDKGNINVIQQKGWINLCQHLNFCDVNTASKIIKLQLKQKNTQGLTQQHLQQILFELGTKKQIQSDLEDYDKAKMACCAKFDKFLMNLKLPKGNQKLKEYFIGLKNQVAKKQKQQLTVTNPNGEKQTWEIKQ